LTIPLQNDSQPKTIPSAQVNPLLIGISARRLATDWIQKKKGDFDIFSVDRPE
jgi:hypothetical protein